MGEECLHRRRCGLQKHVEGSTVALYHPVDHTYSYISKENTSKKEYKKYLEKI